MSSSKRQNLATAFPRGNFLGINEGIKTRDILHQNPRRIMFISGKSPVVATPLIDHFALNAILTQEKAATTFVELNDYFTAQHLGDFGTILRGGGLTWGPFNTYTLQGQKRFQAVVCQMAELGEEWMKNKNFRVIANEAPYAPPPNIEPGSLMDALTFESAIKFWKKGDLSLASQKAFLSAEIKAEENAIVETILKDRQINIDSLGNNQKTYEEIQDARRNASPELIERSQTLIEQDAMPAFVAFIDPDERKCDFYAVDYEVLFDSQGNLRHFSDIMMMFELRTHERTEKLLLEYFVDSPAKRIKEETGLTRLPSLGPFKDLYLTSDSAPN